MEFTDRWEGGEKLEARAATQSSIMSALQPACSSSPTPCWKTRVRGMYGQGRRRRSSVASNLNLLLLICFQMVQNSTAKLQALVYEILPSTTAVFSYVIGPRKLSANEQFFVGAQTVVSLLQTTQIISDVAMLLTPAQIKPKSFESTRNIFFYPG